MLVIACIGIIPAYAGNTRPRSHATFQSRDHPRIRGEHAPGIASASWFRGSSPHTRGTHGVAKIARVGSGIIPAYAGSTFDNFMRGGVIGDHPRIRGEHTIFNLLLMPIWGSSPHTRGARGRACHRHHLLGIIPAYAGSTCQAPEPRSCSRDHPRIRGEHWMPLAASCAVVGSSPHTRGALCS